MNGYWPSILICVWNYVVGVQMKMELQIVNNATLQRMHTSYFEKQYKVYVFQTVTILTSSVKKNNLKYI